MLDEELGETITQCLIDDGGWLSTPCNQLLGRAASEMELRCHISRRTLAKGYTDGPKMLHKQDSS